MLPLQETDTLVTKDYQKNQNKVMQYYIEKYTTHTKLSALLHVKKKTTTYETTKESEAAVIYTPEFIVEIVV